MLHILSSSPWQCNIDTLFRMLRIEDDLLLIQDGVLASISGNHFEEMITNIDASISVLINDIQARGLVGKTIDKISIVSYAGFVDLAIKQPTQMSW